MARWRCTGLILWHSRRLLFQEALGFKTAVGIITVLNADYDSRRWWRPSEAEEEIMRGVVGFVQKIVMRICRICTEGKTEIWSSVTAGERKLNHKYRWCSRLPWITQRENKCLL